MKNDDVVIVGGGLGDAAFSSLLLSWTRLTSFSCVSKLGGSTIPQAKLSALDGEPENNEAQQW